VGLRPEASSIASDGEAGTLQLAVALVEELGADAYVYGELDGDGAAERPWVMRCDSRKVPTIGERVRVALRGEAAHAFNPETGLRLG
jgi:multiple sugar transport system ATP-binding protein